MADQARHEGVRSDRRLFMAAGAAVIGGQLMPAASAQPERVETNNGRGDGAHGGLRRAFIDGTGHGWRELGESDFVNVNCHEDTWVWAEGMLRCSGQPVGVLRSVETYTNFEFVCEWRHNRAAGNSGVFLWTTEDSVAELAAAGKPGLPRGIEVQVLDLAYGGENPEGWYTSHGDVFPVGVEMTPFPPLSPNGVRSFPSKNLTLGAGQWNHYYIRAINGEVRLWVNGEEVSGGNGCEPRSGYLALESEGSPIDFRNLRLRELA